MNSQYRFTVLRHLALAMLAAFGVLSIIASGGGGGGDGGGGGGGTPEIQATITTTNAAALINDVMGTSNPTGGIAAASTRQGATGGQPLSSVRALAQRLEMLYQATLRQAQATGARSRPAFSVDETDPCDFGQGSIHTTGTLNDTNLTGTLNATYTNCLLDGLTYNGHATLTFTAWDLFLLVPIDSTFTISSLTITGPGVNDTVSGSLRDQLNIASDTETLTFNDVTTDNTTGKTLKTHNLVFVFVYNDIFSPSSYTLTMTGRVWDSLYGYVDVLTVTPFVFASISQLFPDSGQVILFGMNNASIRVTALSSVLLMVELDLDGDSAYELTATLKWTDLGGPIGADLGDEDMDGMHNSWESFYTLDPFDAGDRDLDLDADGSTNLREYLSGSNPNDPTSTPPPRALTLQTSDIIYDPVSRKIYASIPSGAASMADSITIVDPTSGQVEASVPIGTNPGRLAVSDDGQFLYVGLNGTSGSIRRFDIASQTAGPEFLLGSDPFFGSYFAEDIEVSPGNPLTVAVSLQYKGVSPRHAGVAIYDNGVQRPTATPGHTGSNVIEFGGSAATLYGYNNETTEFGFRTILVDTTGVTVVDVTQGLISGFGVDIEHDGGRIYSTTGRIIDPVNRTLIGTFPIGTSSGLVEPDFAVGRVFFLTAGVTTTLQAFDANSLAFVGSLEISGVNGNPTSLIRWGSNGLAFRTDQNQLFLIETSLVQ